MNISDGELMEGILEGDGYQLVERPEDADVILVNTCSIRENAERRVIGRVGQLNQLREVRPNLILGVTGCMAQRIGGTLLSDAPYVDLVMGPDAYRSLPERLGQLRAGESRMPRTNRRSSAPPAIKGRRRIQLEVLDLDPRENYAGLEQRRTSAIQAWLPIQRGCDHRCTYCIVPYVRGDEKNRDPLEVLKEVRGLAEQGITEVTLLGQTVNSYVHGDTDFPSLLRDVARVDGMRRVRFTSPHPSDVTPALIDVMASEPAVCEQLHLPVQAGSDRTLKRMLRRYTVASFLDTVAAVRKAIPDIALSTDVIVAFPGETEAEFDETLALMEAVRFDDAFTYRYSPREGTPATRLPAEDFVDEDVGQARLTRLIEDTRRIQGDINHGELGRVEELLVERDGKSPDTYLGRTRRAKVVVFEKGDEKPGEYVYVRLDSTTGPTFVGTRVAATDPGARA